MGAGERVRETFPDVVVAAAEPMPGDPVMGLRSLDDGYVPPILDVTRLDRKVLVSNEDSVSAVRELLRLEGIFGGVSAGAVLHVARRLADELEEGVVVAVLADGGWKYLSADFWDATRRGRRVLDGVDRLVVIPAAVRSAIAEHAHAELPNEACGLLLLEGDVAVEYVPAENASPSPYFFELRLDPVVWADIGERDVEQAVVHSHVSSPPRPSRTDVERIGLWQGRPYVIYSVRLDELAAWRIVGRRDRADPDRLRHPARAPGTSSLDLELDG